jgi:hypothetical protein
MRELRKSRKTPEFSTSPLRAEQTNARNLETAGWGQKRLRTLSRTDSFLAEIQRQRKKQYRHGEVCLLGHRDSRAALVPNTGLRSGAMPSSLA